MASEASATLSASIVAALKERILNWHYPPEHRLTEDGLCREFGVSRSPVREALHVLATNGFVRRMDNRGYAVRQIKVGELEDLYDVRLALELFAVEKLAASGTSAEEVASLAQTWRAVLQRPPHDVEDLAKLDAEFHEGLARAAGNMQLLQQLQDINERLLVFRTIDFAEKNRVQSTCAQHLAILERIAAGDVDGARAALRRNIEEGRNIVGNSVKEALARAYARS
jgi:DNA-binding GntR family transcriptional regulator